MVTVPHEFPVAIQHHPSQPVGEAGFRLSQPACIGFTDPISSTQIATSLNKKPFDIFNPQKETKKLALGRYRADQAQPHDRLAGGIGPDFNATAKGTR